MNNSNPNTNPNPSSSQPKDSAEEEESSSSISLEASKVAEKAETTAVEEDVPMAVPEKEAAAAATASTGDDMMDVDNVNPATVFTIRLKQPRSNLLHKMSVPELCRNFR